MLFIVPWLPGVRDSPLAPAIFMLAVLVNIGYLSWCSHDGVKAFRSRAYVPNTSLYTPMHDASYGRLYWSKHRSEWGRSIAAYSFYADNWLIVTLWLDASGQFLEAETAEGRWIGTYEGGRNSILRISLEPSPLRTVVMYEDGSSGPRSDRIELPNGRVCKFDQDWSFSMSLPGVGFNLPVVRQMLVDDVRHPLVIFNAKQGDGYIEPEAAALPDLPMLVVVAAYLFVKAQYYDTGG
jgi:hypothetical protein